MTTIDVYLENEGTDVWRPVSAEQVSSDTYRIIDPSEADLGEEWQFHCGNVVRCTFKIFSEGQKELVAIELVH